METAAAKWSIKKILVATDFGKAAEAALDAATEIADKFGASVLLMHAYRVPVDSYTHVPLVTMTELAAHVEASAQKALGEAASRYRGKGAITTALHIGTPWEQILRAARDEGVSLIIMGSRGLRGLPRALMGSTAERVARYAHVPIMIVHGTPPAIASGVPRDGAKAADDSLEPWLI
jgi:nucleotide-binding universal stress UspA family protein